MTCRAATAHRGRECDADDPDTCPADVCVDRRVNLGLANVPQWATRIISGPLPYQIGEAKEDDDGEWAHSITMCGVHVADVSEARVSNDADRCSAAHDSEDRWVIPSSLPQFYVARTERGSNVVVMYDPIDNSAHVAHTLCDDDIDTAIEFGATAWRTAMKYRGQTHILCAAARAAI